MFFPKPVLLFCFQLSTAIFDLKIIHFIVFKLSSTLKWQKMPQKAVVSDAFLSVKVKMSGLVWREVDVKV